MKWFTGWIRPDHRWNSSETLTQTLSTLESGQSTVMNINRYDTTYRNGILVTKVRVSYVKITSTQRNTGNLDGNTGLLTSLLTGKQGISSLKEMPCCPTDDLLWVQITRSYPNRLRFWRLPFPESPCHGVIDPRFQKYFGRR